MLRDETLRKVVNDIGTNFDALTNEQLDGLRTAADVLLHQDPCFQQFMRDTRGETVPQEQRKCASAQ